jgi:hypothetical protein
VVPWSIQGAHWEALPDGGGPEVPRNGDCVHCGEPLGDVVVTLVRHRGEHRIQDAFCSVAHMAEWAKAGGRWR